MEITIYVADEHLRGIPFDRYSNVLHDLVYNGFMPDSIDIRPGPTTVVLVDGHPDTDDAREILEMATDITTEVNVDGLFGYADWKRLYGNRGELSETPA